MFKLQNETFISCLFEIVKTQRKKSTIPNAKKNKYEEILLNQKLPGESEMDSTTAISSYMFFVEGKRQKTNPSEKMTRRRRPHKLMKT